MKLLLFLKFFSRSLTPNMTNMSVWLRSVEMSPLKARGRFFFYTEWPSMYHIFCQFVQSKLEHMSDLFIWIRSHCFSTEYKVICSISIPKFVCFRSTESVQDPEEILNEADVKLDAVRQKIGQIAEELKGEDIYQFHRAFTPGEFSYTRTVKDRKRAKWTSKYCYFPWEYIFSAKFLRFHLMLNHRPKKKNKTHIYLLRDYQHPS